MPYVHPSHPTSTQRHSQKNYTNLTVLNSLPVIYQTILGGSRWLQPFQLTALL